MTEIPLLQFLPALLVFNVVGTDRVLVGDYLGAAAKLVLFMAAVTVLVFLKPAPRPLARTERWLSTARVLVLALVLWWAWDVAVALRALLLRPRAPQLYGRCLQVQYSKHHWLPLFSVFVLVGVAVFL